MARKQRTDELLVSIGKTLYWLDRQLSEAEDLSLPDVTGHLEQALLELGEAKAQLHQLSFQFGPSAAAQHRPSGSQKR